jgi:hypothetical protein
VAVAMLTAFKRWSFLLPCPSEIHINNSLAEIE